MKSNHSVKTSSKPVITFLVNLLAGIIIIITGCSNQSGISWQNTPKDGVKAGEVIELVFDVNRDITNPYNSDEIGIIFNVWQENGDTLAVPAFYFVPYTSNGHNLIRNGEPVWKVRFTPKLSGEYFYNLTVDHEDERAETAVQSFNVTENNYKGFIQAKRGDRLFRYSSGEVFFPSGLNLAHPPHTGGPLEYDYFFQKMEDNSMNFMRIWLTPQWGEYAIALEWTDNQYPSHKGNLGLRKINSEMAYRLDSNMESAMEHGIYVMLCLLDERELEERSHWKENPYNTEAGGVISEPMEFFSDEGAKDAFRNRLRYLIARYSAYPNLFAWEFWNEFDHHRLIPDWENRRQNVGKWHHEMSRYLKQNDPHNHMVSTSVVGSRTDKIIWDYEEIDFVQAHSYVGKDHLADRSHDLFKLFEEEYPDRPFIIGEMGTDWHGFTRENNAEGTGLHNGIWESSLGGHSGTGMWWWWYEIDEAQLWNEWKYIADFTIGMDREKSNYYFVQPDTKAQIAGRYVVSGDSIWVWFYNRDNNWKNIKEGISITNTNPKQYYLTNIPAGSYQIRQFENGKFTKSGQLESNGTALIHLPPFMADYAALLVPDNITASNPIETKMTAVHYCTSSKRAHFIVHPSIKEAIIQVYTISGNLLTSTRFTGKSSQNYYLHLPDISPQVLVYRIVTAVKVESGKFNYR